MGIDCCGKTASPQTLSWDCPSGELAISEGNSVALPNTVNVYSFEITPGVVEQIWSGDGNAAPHGNSSDIFNGAPVSPAGLPGHINGAPDIDAVVPDWVDNTANDPSNGSDQFRYYGWIYIEQDGTQLQDNNNNSGERLRIWVGECCGSPSVVFESNVDTTGGAGSGTSGPFVTLDRGWHFLAFEGSDLSAFAGVEIEVDNGGDGVFANFSGQTSVTFPRQSCRQETCDYVLLAEESLCPDLSKCQGQAVESSSVAVIPTFVEVDQGFLAKADVTGNGNAASTILDLSQVRADAGWAVAGNAVTYTGSPDRVRIDAMAFYEEPQNAAFARIAPEIELLKNGVVVAHSASAYQRHATGHDSSSNTIAWTDEAPGANPVYELRAQQGSTQVDVLNVALGHFSLEAIEKIQVVGSV